MICKSRQYPSIAGLPSNSTYPLRPSSFLVSRRTPFPSSRNVMTCFLHNACSTLIDGLGWGHWEGGESRMQLWERDCCCVLAWGREVDRLGVAPLNHFRGWRCINVSRKITRVDVSISCSQLFTHRRIISMLFVLSSSTPLRDSICVGCIDITLSLFLLSFFSHVTVFCEIRMKFPDHFTLIGNRDRWSLDPDDEETFRRFEKNLRSYLWELCHCWYWKDERNCKERDKTRFFNAELI